MIRKIIIGFVLVFGLSVQSQSKKTQPSYEAKVKNYVLWFESLPDHKKREEANVLVMNLNMMSAYDRGMWLATSAKYSKHKETPEVKEILIDSLSNEGVKKKLFADSTKQVGEKVDTIIILSSSIAKDRIVASNAEVRKKIADWKVVINESERKLDSILGTARNQDHSMANSRIVDDLVDKSEEGNRELISLRRDLITYSDEEAYKWNSYLIDKYELEVQISVPHKLTNEELDSGIPSGIKFDKKEKKYFAKFERGYKNGNRWDEYSSFQLERIDGND
ncbi:hypothetical protein [Flavobacterium frigoris]|uniref:Uncharacterized protein n=1 Tax=Flavobacterium frigoris TaxID=229204 RepID=A0A1H9I2C9_FLAFI|nr:hypothetical protein [Flavobacterium frigoris]SEQ68615.1 hypothetical protein SAMN05444355_103335 [Flavobacterium frigoris]